MSSDINVRLEIARAIVDREAVEPRQQVHADYHRRLAAEIPHVENRSVRGNAPGIVDVERFQVDARHGDELAHQLVPRNAVHADIVHALQAGRCFRNASLSAMSAM
jgi:hypothetical protein